MSFNKWAIVFGVLNGIAAIIGLVAVFFPDTFNMQKKDEPEKVIVIEKKSKYEKLKMTVNTGEDFKEFMDFIHAREEDKKPFIIDSYICNSTLEDIAKFNVKMDDQSFITYRSFLEGDEFNITDRSYLEDYDNQQLASLLEETNSTIEDLFIVGDSISKEDNDYHACMTGFENCLYDTYIFPKKIVEIGYNYSTVGDCKSLAAYHLSGNLIFYSFGSKHGEGRIVFREANPIDFQTQE